MSERRLRALLFLIALALCAWGCPKIEWTPAKCPAGQHWCDEHGGGCLPDGTPCGPYVPPPVTTITTTTQPPAPTPEPTKPPEPPPSSACPKPLAEGAFAYVDLKSYGNGWDTETRVYGDPEFCRAIHGVPAQSCHLEGWAKRNECELELLGGCPVFEYRLPGGKWTRCREVGREFSCDHFGSAGGGRDDPQTKAFEGTPAVCGLQRDDTGKPQAGFWMVAHGKGQVRACDASGKHCGECRTPKAEGCEVDW